MYESGPSAASTGANAGRSFHASAGAGRSRVNLLNWTLQRFFPELSPASDTSDEAAALVSGERRVTTMRPDWWQSAPAYPMTGWPSGCTWPGAARPPNGPAAAERGSGVACPMRWPRRRSTSRPSICDADPRYLTPGYQFLHRAGRDAGARHRLPRARRGRRVPRCLTACPPHSPPPSTPEAGGRLRPSTAEAAHEKRN